MTSAANPSSASAALVELSAELRQLALVPGWDRPGGPPLWDDPRTPFGSRSWRYGDAREALLRAGDLVSPDLAERRNLILANPVAGNGYPTVRTQVLAYQLLLPGERARTHRHTPHAGRLILEADEGAFTIVDGVKIPMAPGDVVLTPSWSWHGHGHDGAAPALWLDFLDVPLVQLLDPMFFERFPGDWQEASSESRFTSLLFAYEDTVALLDAAEPDADGCFGRRVGLGSPALPTIGLFVHRTDPEDRTVAFRSTANHQYCVIEGSGSTWIDGIEHGWSRGDVIVVPCWSEQRHEAATTATVLGITDEPLQQYCGFLRTLIRSS